MIRSRSGGGGRLWRSFEDFGAGVGAEEIFWTGLQDWEDLQDGEEDETRTRTGRRTRTRRRIIFGVGVLGSG